MADGARSGTGGHASHAVSLLLCETFSAFEASDRRAGLLLIHPSDLRDLSRSSGSGFVRSRRAARPEWRGNLVGDLWGAHVVETDTVPAGDPLVLPESAALLSEMRASSRAESLRLAGALRALRRRLRRVRPFGLSRRGYS